LAALVASGELFAQVPMTSSYASLGPSFTILDIERPSPAGTLRVSGVSIVGEAGVVLSVFSADARLATGSLDYEDAEGSATLAEAELMVGFRPLRWVALQVGPHLRKLDTTQSENWVFWEARIWFGATLLERVAYSYMKGWLILSASEPENTTFDNGFGFEGGLLLKTTTLPVWVKTGYRIDRVTFNELSSADTPQQLFLLFGINFNI
jgi:hypothetical protein